jgi:hypothetical protein
LPLTDGRLRSAWGERLYRVLVSSKAPVERGAFEFRIVRA